MNNNSKEPLFHIVKRGALPWYKAWGIRLLAVVIALIVCAIITMTVTGENPIQVYATMIDSSFGSERKVWILAQNTAMLLGVSLAVTPAFRMRFWNIGGEGQILAGCLAAAACMICLADTVPNGLLIAISAVASIIAGAIWGGIPEHMVNLVDIRSDAPQSVQDDIQAAYNKMAAREFSPFTGPIVTNEGQTVVEAGKTAPDDVLLNMNWLVKGVVGKVPTMN